MDIFQPPLLLMRNQVFIIILLFLIIFSCLLSRFFSLFLAFSSLPIMHLVVGFFLCVFYLEVTDLGSLSWFFFFFNQTWEVFSHSLSKYFSASFSALSIGLQLRQLVFSFSPQELCTDTKSPQSKQQTCKSHLLQCLSMAIFHLFFIALMTGPYNLPCILTAAS